MLLALSPRCVEAIAAAVAKLFTLEDFFQGEKGLETCMSHETPDFLPQATSQPITGLKQSQVCAC